MAAQRGFLVPALDHADHRLERRLLRIGQIERDAHIGAYQLAGVVAVRDVRSRWTGAGAAVDLVLEVDAGLPTRDRHGNVVPEVWTQHGATEEVSTQLLDVSVVRQMLQDQLKAHMEARKEMLLALYCVDFVLPFEEDTPEALIQRVKPDVLVKGEDYQESEIVGAEFWMSTLAETLVPPSEPSWGVTEQTTVSPLAKAPDKVAAVPISVPSRVHE